MGRRWRSKKQQGKDNQGEGAAFELHIEGTFPLLLAQRKAVAYKVPNPVKIHHVNQRGHVRGSTATAVWTDFGGFLWGSGRGLAFEAKVESCKTRFEFANLEDHQFEKLHTGAKAGAVSFLLVRRKLNEIRARDYVLPVSPGGAIAHVTHKRIKLRGELHRESVPWPRADALELAFKPNECWYDALMRVMSDHPMLFTEDP